MVYLIIILAFLAALSGISFYFSKRVNTGTGFLTAERSIPWYVNSGSIFATYLGSGTLIGGAALAYEYGIAGAWFDIGGVLALIILALMAKRIRRYQASTTPDILGARFNKATRTIAAVIVCCAEMAMVGYQIRAGGYVLNIVAGLDVNVGMIITIAFILLYTVTAGLISVVYTDYIQGLLIIISLAVGLPFLFNDAGGFSAFMANVEPARMNLFSMSLNEIVSTALPTFCLVFVLQPIWQRIFSVKDDKGCVRAVVVSVPFVLGAVLLVNLFATVGSFLYPDIVQDTVILHLAVTGLPKLIGAILLCAGVAIIITTGDSMLLSSSSNIVTDIYKEYINKEASEKHLLVMSRVMVVAVGIVAFVLVKFFPSVLDMVYFAYTMEGGLAPALFAAFYFKKVTPAAGMCSVLGSGITTVLWEVLGHPGGISTIYPVMAVAIGMLVVVSLFTKQTDEKVLKVFFADEN